MTYMVGSLFSGIGGIEKGFELAGFHTAWQCEIDPNARMILARHWPDVERHNDVTLVDGSCIAPVDVITFGSPCQGLSVAGTQQGLDDARSSLFWEAIRIIKEMRDATQHRFPKIALWENVPGAFSSHKGRDFAAVLDALAECGAVDLGWRVIDAQHWVPQRRSRVFVVASFPPFASGHLGEERAQTILALHEGRAGNFTTRAKPQARVATPLTSGSHGNGISRPGRHLEDDFNLVPVAHTLSAHHHRMDPNAEEFIVAHTLRGEGCDASEDGTGRGVPLIPVCPGGNTAESYWKETDVANTVAAGHFPWQGTRIANPATLGVRRLTPTECARLQGFPDNWLDGLSDTAKYTLLGNAVAIPVIQWIAERMHGALDQN